MVLDSPSDGSTSGCYALTECLESQGIGRPY